MRPSQQLTEWIAAQLRIRSPGAELPTDRELAAAWKVSKRTVGSVMRSFARRGDIVRIPGRDTQVASAHVATADRVVETQRSSAGQLRDLIFRAICRGEFKMGERLPSIKYMSRVFRVSARTVIAAYRELQRENYAVKVGKNVFLGEFPRLVHQ